MSEVISFADPQLPCHGCAHSASSAPFPGYPSGERPCCFCARNPDHDAYGWLADIGSSHDGVWYDGTPAVHTPMDCYIAGDRLDQERVFVEAAKGDA